MISICISRHEAGVLFDDTHTRALLYGVYVEFIAFSAFVGVTVSVVMCYIFLQDAHHMTIHAVTLKVKKNSLSVLLIGHC